MLRTCVVLGGAAALLAACGNGGGGEDACELPAFEHGGDGHTDPLGAGPSEARAGRVTAADLPATPSGLLTWAAGDYVVANDRIAVVIEDVGPSDLYDPWGGRPVGIARVVDGKLTEPGDFGEFFVLTGRFGVVTEQVSVIADGSDGGPAIVRASGPLAPLPFFEALVGTLIRDDYADLRAAIDYVLEPGADHVDIVMTYQSIREDVTAVNVILHGFMYTKRTVPFIPGVGFDSEGEDAPYVAFVDDDATSFAYSLPGEVLQGAITQSGFFSLLSDEFELAACGETTRTHARITVAGPGLDAVVAAVARTDGTAVRELTGTVRDATGAPVAGVRVHAESADGDYLTRAPTGGDGVYTLHVPDDIDVDLTAFAPGIAFVGPTRVAAGDGGADLDLPDTGTIQVVATDQADGAALPVRVQVLPDAGFELPAPPASFGEEVPASGRLHIAYAADGDVTLAVPVGDWDVIVSRGYEYEIHRETAPVGPGDAVVVEAALERSVDTTGLQCADYHIHTHRSADSGDDARLKIASAVADGLEIPVRSDHEFVNDFQPLIEELGVEAWAFGVTSVEMTSFQVWGHMGVLPLERDDTRQNGGTPLWQTYPSAEDPGAEVVTLSPPELFAQVRARPEQPIIIINHPRGSVNYFDYAGYDNLTGEVAFPDDWDEEFRVVEFFNGSGWRSNRDGLVADWLSFLDAGRRVFAVGSSDSHAIRGSPVGYPRTCLRVGTDDPRDLTPEIVKDATAGGHAAISGGLYIDASVGSAGPGDEVTGAGAQVDLRVRIQAPSWIDVDWVEIVVDGETYDMIAVAPTDGDPQDPAVRFDQVIPIDVAGGLGSYVIVAAWSEGDLSPVHPGRAAFGVTNPIFLVP